MLNYVFAFLAFLQNPAPPPFTFAILGDRTGEAQPGVFEQLLRDTAADNPAFIVSPGDMIEGLKDESAGAEWARLARMLAPYQKFQLYLAPGNHDVWSGASTDLFVEHSGHPLHYGFDYRQAHFTILDNSRTEEFTVAELDFLESDLRAHASQPVKFIISHRPSWIMNVLLRNPDFQLHKLAKKYGVQYVISGHIHQMWRAELDGVTYFSMPSAGGHLRASKKYQDGWFFGHTLVTVTGQSVTLRIQEAGAPFGSGRSTSPTEWGMSGLNR